MHVSILPPRNFQILQSSGKLLGRRSRIQPGLGRMLGSALTETAPAAFPFVARDVAGTTAFTGVALLTAVAPFERVEPLLRLPAQSISNLEAVLLAAFAAWGLALCSARRLPEWRTTLTVPWLLLIAAMCCATAAAPLARLNALHMTGRVAAAFGVYLLAVNGVTTRARLMGVVVIALVAAAGVSVLAVMEYLTIPAVLQWLKAFRPQVMTVGALVRAGGSLQYPTIASMYLEIVFALGVGLMVASRDDSRRGRAVMVFVTLLLIAYAITLTFTRSGLILMAAALVWIGMMRARHTGLDGGVGLVALLGVAVLALFLASRSLDSIWLRFTSEGQESWYRADIEAPASVTLATGGISRVPLTVTNRGRLDWSSQAESPFFLSYHWMVEEDERYVVFDGVRTPFDATVSSGATVAIEANVRAPRRPGRYRLVWDVVQERRTWFSDEPGSTPSISLAKVEGPALAGAPQPFPRPRPRWRPGRLVLWGAAARMFAAYPLLGVGPDNFRLTYPRYAGLTAGDPRTHSNNMYLEVVAGGGLVTALAFVWFVWSAARMCRAALGPAKAGRHVPNALGLAVAAACIAIAAHGLVDSFLAFAPTYMLFSLTLGLAAACARGVETCADAHRI
jgi:O-Antigen ligase